VSPPSGADQDAVVAQLVRAPVCGTGGRWFEPTQLYQPSTPANLCTPSARVGCSRSITPSRPSILNLRLSSVQAPSFLVAVRVAVPAPFGPLTEKLSAASPVAPRTEILPVGMPAVIGLPRRFATSALPSILETAIL